MEAMDRLSAHLKNRLAELGQAKKEGGKVVAYTPGGFLPEELVLASGAIPVGLIRGGDHSMVEMAGREVRFGNYHSNFGIVQRCAQAVQDLHADGFIFNCRPLAQPSHFLKKWIEENLGIPTLSLEADNYDSRAYSAEALKTKVETFAEILRARKAAAKV